MTKNMRPLFHAMLQAVHDAVQQAIEENVQFDVRANVFTLFAVTGVILFWRGVRGCVAGAGAGAWQDVVRGSWRTSPTTTGSLTVLHFQVWNTWDALFGTELASNIASMVRPSRRCLRPRRPASQVCRPRCVARGAGCGCASPAGLAALAWALTAGAC